MKKHKELVLRRARELAKLHRRWVYLEGWGRGFMRQQGDDPDLVSTWFLLGDDDRCPVDGLAIHPAAVRNIRGIRTDRFSPSIRLKEIVIHDQIVDPQTGEVIASPDRKPDLETISRILYLSDTLDAVDGIENAWSWA